MTRLLAPALLTLTACIYDVPLGESDEGILLEQFHCRDEWRIAIETQLAPDASSLVIGGVSFEKNFSNRGDIEVHFDGPEDRIIVEARRFTFASSEEAARAAR